MGVRITIGNLDYEATDYSVQEASGPTAAGDSSGSVGTINFTIPRPNPDARGKTVTPLLIEDPNNPGFLMEVSP